MKIKILLVDDHKVVIKGLSFFLSSRAEFDIVGEAHNGKEAIEQVELLHPDVVLMDLLMPIKNGIEATKEIKQRYPEIRVLVLTSSADRDHIYPALKAGANGYLLKDAHPDQLVEAIRGAYIGNVQLHPEITNHLMNLSHNTNSVETPPSDFKIAPLELTNREKEVLCLIASGRNNKEIASDLVISEKTVKTHVSHILNKLDLTDRTQAALFAIKYGIAVPPSFDNSD